MNSTKSLLIVHLRRQSLSLHCLISSLFALPKPSQLFYSFFKTLVGKEVAVELKNDVALTGILHSVDQYLNVKLTDVKVVDEDRFPQLAAMKGCFIRGSVVRYIQIPATEVDTELLQDACRKENAASGK